MDPIKKRSMGYQALSILLTCNRELDIQQVVFMTYTPKLKEMLIVANVITVRFFLSFTLILLQTINTDLKSRARDV